MKKSIFGFCKKTLCVFLSVVMVLSAWVFIAPDTLPKASAAAGSYTAHAWVVVTNSMDNVYMELKLYGKTNNGKGSEQQIGSTLKWNETDVGENSYDIFNGSTAAGVFPTRINVYLGSEQYYFGRDIEFEVHLNIQGSDFYLNATRHSYTAKEVSVSSGNPATFYWDTKYHVTQGANNAFNCDFSVGGGDYPTAQCAGFSGGSSALNVPTTEDGVNATNAFSYTVGTPKDQYGVNWFQDITVGLASNYTGVTFDGSGKKISVNCNANRAPVNGQYKYTIKLVQRLGGAQVNSASIQINTWKYIVTFYDADTGSVLCSRYVDYGESAAPPKQAAADPSHHFFFESLDESFIDIKSGGQEKSVYGRFVEHDCYGGDWEGFHWDLRDGVLTIIGSGEMPDGPFPWLAEHATEITTVELDERITRIGSGAFSNCTLLREISIPENVASVGAEAFHNTALYNDNSNWSNGMFYIDHCMIKANEEIAGNCIVRDETTVIADEAFAGCSGLISIELPDSLIGIGENAFLETGIYNDNSLWSNDALYLDDYLIVAKASIKNPYSIQEGTVLIADGALTSCSELTQVWIPKGVAHIGRRAFSECNSLERVYYEGTMNQWGQIVISVCNDPLINVISLGKLWPEHKHNFSKSISCATLGTKTFTCSCGESYAEEILNPFKNGKYYVRVATWGKTTEEDHFYAKLTYSTKTGDETIDLPLVDDLAWHETDYELNGFPVKINAGAHGNPTSYGEVDVRIFVYSDSEYSLNEIELVNYFKVEVGYIGGADVDGTYDITTNTVQKYSERGTVSNPDVNNYSSFLEMHNWQKVGIRKQATCSEEGALLYTCTECGECYSQAIKRDSSNHADYGTHIANDKAATCTENGYTGNTVCNGCGVTLIRGKSIPSFGHDYVATHVDATTEEDGYTEFVCSNCGDSYTVPDPAAPVESFIAFGTVNAINLSWLKAVETSVTGYNLYRKTADSDTFELLTAITSRNTVSYVDTNLTVGTEYFYRICAMKGEVEGDYSEPISAAALPDEEIPVITSLSPKSGSTVSGTINIKATATDNVAVTKYTVFYSLGEEEPWNEVQSVEGPSCNIPFDTTMVRDGIVNVKVVAYDQLNNASDGSPVVTYLVDNTAPSVVTSLSAIAVYATQLTLSWEKPENEGVASFVLQQKHNEDVTTVASGITTLGYNVFNLIPDSAYKYRVAAVDSSGNVSDYSDWLSVTTKPDTTSPVITAQSPVPGRYSSMIPFSVTASDDYGIRAITVQYSTNKTEWSDVEDVSYTTPVTKQTKKFSVNLSTFDEGDLYLRGIAEDFYGNVSITDATAPFVQYVVDKTPPQKPQQVEAVGGDGYITVSWKQGNEADISGYYVYRSTVENGAFDKISSKLSTLNHYDRNVIRDTTYYYKIEAVDSCGNVSEQSAVVSAKALLDTIKPTIQSISPAYGSSIGANNNRIGILANDNNMLKSIVVEYKYDGDYKVLKTFDNVNASNKVVYVSLPVGSYNHGDDIYLRAFCVDTAGYTSEYSSAVKYTIDNVAPGLTNLSCVINDGVCTLKWNDTNDSDLSGFKVYRSTNGGSYEAIGSRACSSSHYYTFNDTVSEGLHTYRIDCVDKSGNSAFYYSESVKWTKPSQIKAVITSETYLEQGVQEVFSASKSTSDNSITSYLWNFGDGTTSNKINVTKAYNKVGVYTVTLKITDIEGNVSTASKVITVAERELLGVAKVRVVNENGSAISNAPVYFDLGEENQQIVYTNASGYASLIMTVGTHIVGSYKNGFLPVSGNIAVLANTTSEVTLTMVEQELITGEFEVHEMTFEEIIDAGIDVNDPANQQIYEVKVILIYGEEKIPVTYVRNDTEIISYTIGNIGGGTGVGGSQGHGKINHISFVPNEMNQEIIAVVEIPITASYLKQFYSANLHIVNNAAAGYEIVNCEANISVPEGLTVVQHTPISSVIDGQQSSSANWILRGDKAGSYNLSANFNGVLDTFNVPISASFTADEPVVVYGPDSVKLRIEVQEEIDEKLFFNVCLVNNRPVNVNRPRINAVDYVKNITEYYKRSLIEAGADENDVKYIATNFLRMGVISAEGKATFYDVSEPEENPVDVLEPGETVIYEYSVDRITDYAGTGYFNKAIVECDDYYASSIEIVTMGKTPVVITEEQFVKEHQDFINSSEWKYADTKFPERLSNALKEEWEDDWYEFIEFDYFTNYADIVLADYMLQESTYSVMESEYEKLIYDAAKTSYKTISSLIWNDIWDLAVVKESDLTQNKIYKILTGDHYESNEYKTFRSIITDKISDGTVKSFFNVLYAVDVGMSIADFYGDSVEKMRSAINYGSALTAYSKCNNEQFKAIFESAITNLGEDEKKMKNAMEEFISYDNSSEFSAKLKQFIIDMKCGATIVTDAAVRSWLFVYKDMYLARIKVFASEAMHKLLPALSAGSDFVIAEIANGLCLGYQLGVAVSKLVANTGNLNLILSQLEYYTQLAAALEKETRIREKSFISSKTYEDATYFCTSFNSFKTAWLATAELFTQFAIQKNEAIATKIFAKDKFKDNIAQSVRDVTRIKQLYCHNVSHVVEESKAKVVVVECPVDVYVYNNNGDLLAKVTDSETTINDQLIYAITYDGKKMVSMPSTDEYNIKIIATDSGKMDYTVLEYSSDFNIRRVVFEDIELEENDVFEGYIDSVLLTDKNNYALTKNSNDVITATEDIEHQVTGITLDKKTVTIQCGENIELTADVDPSDAENTDITWSSYDQTIATVSESGVVKALKPGEVVVKAVTEDGGYVAYCTVVVQCSNHKYGQWVIIEQPSCKTEGKQTRMCEYCEHVDEQSIEKLTHIGGVATCKARKICLLCNEPYGELDSNNHAPLDAVVENEIPSKCGIKGSYDLVVYCSLCEKELSRETKETEALQHKNEIVVGKAPTCTKTGLTDGVICSVCGETLTVQQTIGVLAHKDDNGDYKCDYGCGYKFEKPVEPEQPDSSSDGDCGHLCHKSGFMGFIWKIVRFFLKLFKINPICSCGAAHY